MKISMKLFLAFSALILIMGGVGGIGLLYSGKIHALLNQTAPLINTSTELQNTLIAYLSVFNSNDEEQLKHSVETLERLKASIHATYTLLAEEQSDEMSDERVRQEETLFQQAHESIETYQHVLTFQQQLSLDQQIADFQAQRRALDEILGELAGQSETNINQKEDAGRTLVQSGSASPEDLSRLLIELFNEDYPVIESAARLQRYLVQLEDVSKNYLIEQHEEKFPAIADEFSRLLKLANSRVKRLQARVKDVQGEENVRKLVEGFAALEKIVFAEDGGLFSGHRQKLQHLADIARFQQQIKIRTQEVTAACNVLLDEVGAASEQRRIASETEILQVRKAISLVILFGMLIGAAAAIAITRSISHPVNTIVSIAGLMANGDLTQQIPFEQHGEMKQLADALRKMAERLIEVICGVKMVTDTVAETSENVRTASLKLSSSTSEQAASSEEVSSAIEQMAANVRQSADNADQTARLAAEAAHDAKNSGNAVSQVVDAMREIARKISLIDEVARQTRLLSLNATIEAARAQEYGKGFAVVAAEVRALAERSQFAALEISELVSASVTVADQTGELLLHLVPKIENTAVLIQEISSSSREQDVGTAQISQSIIQLNQTIQQNASATEEMAATVGTFTSQAVQLQNAMTFFKTSDCSTTTFTLGH